MSLTDALRDYCKLSLSEADAARWLSELQRTYGRGLCDTEIIEAIEWATWQPKLRYVRPALSDVRKWIGMHRKAGRDAGSTPTSDCAGCVGSPGWFSWSPLYISMHPDIATFRCAVPCACSMGRQIAFTQYPNGVVLNGVTYQHDQLAAFITQCIQARAELDAQIATQHATDSTHPLPDFLSKPQHQDAETRIKEGSNVA